MALSAGDYVEFFTVQDAENAARLRGPGEPWPQQPDRAALGEGVYAWADRAEAEDYRRSLVAIVDELPELEIVLFRVPSTVLSAFQQLHLDLLSDAETEEWLARYSLLWGGTPDHGLEYLQRGTQFGAEHFFARSVFHHLHFAE